MSFEMILVKHEALTVPHYVLVHILDETQNQMRP